MGRRIPISVYNRLSGTSYRSSPFINGFRNTRRIDRGYDVRGNGDENGQKPSSDPPFSDSQIKIHPLLRLALLRSRGIGHLNSIQNSAFLSILSGRDVTIHAPVGSGKTLAYLLPIVNNIYNIHDLLEDLQHNSGEKRGNDREDAIRLKSLGYSRTIPHALLPITLKDLKQDPVEFERQGIRMLESKTTSEKLVDTLYKVDPKQLKQHSNALPLISRRLWGRKSRNAVFRALMSNPLGSVRCCVIVVPNKDLVSQVMNELALIDPLGRLSVQTLTQVHRLPPRTTDNEATDVTLEHSDQPFFPSQHTLHHFSGVHKNLHLSLEDEREMLQSIPVSPVAEGTVETVPVNMGRKAKQLVKVPLKHEVSMQLARENYSGDGFVARSVKFMKQPVINHPIIQYGSCDIVVTTPQLFLNDILSTKKLNVVPACVVFDEVDSLFENNASRMAMMEICSHLRPRPRSYNPFVDTSRPRRRELPPCQFVHVASTLNYGGMQTTGSMLYERFTTSNVISTSRNHHIMGTDMQFIDVQPEFESKVKKLMELLIDSPFAKTVVYFESLKGLRAIYDLLKERDWPVLSFHGRSTLATRVALLEAFRTEEIAILLCTDLLSRGIQLDADHVINFNFPRSAATFVHRVKGHSVRVTNFIEPSDKVFASEISKVYKSKRPVNHLFSRKRSLRKRRDRAQDNPNPRDSDRIARKTSNVMRNKSGFNSESPEYRDSFVPGTGMHASDEVKVGPSVLASDSSTERIEADSNDHSSKGIRYRRRSLRQRGMDFYDNFSAFS
ncbi:hypothetical protein X943_002801 [Babesia divergens]|uniref:ATP-dependent RNA helicase n=1 Tax=Babesia divergens TaxID=32595 RepID=A0AAD9LEF4_BABDI|nr:hypothetical protein X943_002801 [Babesia divergens]